MMIIPPNTDEVMEKPMKTLAWEINERKIENTIWSNNEHVSTRKS